MGSRDGGHSWSKLGLPVTLDELQPLGPHVRAGVSDWPCSSCFSTDLCQGDPSRPGWPGLWSSVLFRGHCLCSETFLFPPTWQ